MDLTVNTPKPYKLGGKSGKGFMPGQTGNPKGRPAAGMQSFKDRLAYWLDTKTIDQIKALVEEGSKKGGKLLAIDAIVAKRIKRAYDNDGNADFNSILDRLLGKPAITGDLQVTHALGDRLDQAEKLLAIDAAFEIIDTTPKAIDHAPISQDDDFSDLI